MASILVGTCGFCMRQEQYFRTFAAIELQQTFYQPPRIETVRRWREAAPESFEFALKAFQAITHGPESPTYRRCRLSEEARKECGGFRDTAIVRGAWEATRSIAEELAARVVVFQCPASFRPTEGNLANLRRFFEWAPRGQLRFAWEPRGPAWTDDIVRTLCRQLELIHVTDPLGCKMGTLSKCASTGPIRYYRLHGMTGYKYRYTDADLTRLRTLCTAATTYCFFNNIAMGPDARRFVKT